MTVSYDWLFSLPLKNLPYLLGGAWLTLRLSFIATVGGLIIAVAVAWGHQLRIPLVSRLLTVYVEVTRNTPVLVQLFLVYFGLPSVGLNMPAAVAAAVVFTFNNGAYLAEILRGGLNAVAYAQIEAGLSLGMTRFQIFRHVLVPPAMRYAAPAMANQFVALTLATSLASQIAAEELTYRATLLEARILHSFEIFAITLVVYFVLAQCLMRVLELANRRLFRVSPVRNIPQL